MNALPSHIRENAIVCYELPSRASYVKKFIQRLALVPQILPLRSGYRGRTRLDHSRNICKVLNKITFNGVDPRLKQDLMTGALCHDIGHAQYGHPGERAINAFFGLDKKFLNNRHSLRILYHRPPVTNADSLPLFRTDPAKQLHSLSPHDTVPSGSDPICVTKRGPPHQGKPARLLDFMDDLENAVGDIGDLVRNFPGTRVPQVVRSLGLDIPVNSADTWAECYRVLRRAVPTMSFESTCKLLEGSSDFPALVKELRREISIARSDNGDILAADHTFYEQTMHLVGRVSDAVFTSTGVSTTSIDTVIDIAASTIV